MFDELLTLVLIPDIFRYGPDGHTVGEPEFQPPAPIRLQWDLNEKAVAAIETSYQVLTIA